MSENSVEISKCEEVVQDVETAKEDVQGSTENQIEEVNDTNAVCFNEIIKNVPVMKIESTPVSVLKTEVDTDNMETDEGTLEKVGYEKEELLRTAENTEDNTVESVSFAVPVLNDTTGKYPEIESVCDVKVIPQIVMDTDIIEVMIESSEDTNNASKKDVIELMKTSVETSTIEEAVKRGI